MSKQDLEKQLKRYYEKESSKSVIPEELLRKWLKRGVHVLNQTTVPEVFSIRTNLFKLLLEKAGGPAAKGKWKKILAEKTGLTQKELTRLKILESKIDKSYQPEDRSLVAKLILFLKVPLSAIRKHVDDKMVKASQAMMLTPTPSLYHAKGVDDREPDKSMFDYSDMLSQNFWDGVAEDVAKKDRYELLDELV